MPKVHLVVGPVGAGKSTFALALAREHMAVRLTLDDWMTTLFAPDRPTEDIPAWYVERARRGVEQIWKVTQDVLGAGKHVILEIGLIRRADRSAFFESAEKANIDLTVHVLDAPRAVRRNRVVRRNDERGETYSMAVPPGIFELASDMWEPLLDDECSGRDVRFVSTD